MKNYELITELMKLPAGYEVEIRTSVSKEIFGKENEAFVIRDVDDIGVSDGTERIEFFC